MRCVNLQGTLFLINQINRTFYLKKCHLLKPSDSIFLYFCGQYDFIKENSHGFSLYYDA